VVRKAVSPLSELLIVWLSSRCHSGVDAIGSCAYIQKTTRLTELIESPSWTAISACRPDMMSVGCEIPILFRLSKGVSALQSAC